MESLAGYLTPVLSIIATIILINQYRLAKYRWRLDLFEKRYPAYLATMEYLAFIRQHLGISQDELFRFMRNVKDKDLLFGNDIQKYLEEVYDNSLQLMELEDGLRHEPTGEKKDRLVAERIRLTEWFGEQFKVAKQMFGKYIRIDR